VPQYHKFNNILRFFKEVSITSEFLPEYLFERFLNVIVTVADFVNFIYEMHGTYSHTMLILVLSPDSSVHSTTSTFPDVLSVSKVLYVTLRDTTNDA